MGRETQLLSKSIGESLGNARTAERKLSHVLEGQTSESASDPENYELLEAEETLAYWISKIFGDLAILAELLGLPLLATRIVKATPRDGHHVCTQVLERAGRNPRTRFRRDDFRATDESASSSGRSSNACGKKAQEPCRKDCLTRRFGDRAAILIDLAAD